MTEEKGLSTDFELMDREDEEQILSELRGVPVEKFIYKNSRGQFELSYAGTKWAVREMANKGEAIRVELPKVERCPIDPEYIIVNIIGKRVKIDRDANCETLLDTNVGSARGWIKQKRQDGSVFPDEFFYNKTVSKATRNVQQALMPSDFKREIIETLIKLQAKAGGARPGTGGARPGAGGPPRQGPPQQNRPPQGPPQQNRPPQGAPPPQQQQNRPPAPPQQQRPPVPGGRPATGGFAGEAPFPASPSQAQQPPQRPPAPPPPQQQRPPQQAQRPAAPPPPPQRQAPPPPRPAPAPVPGVAHQTQSAPHQPPREAAIDVLRQRFEIVLKQAVGATDRNVALQALYRLTGFQKISDLSKELMEEMGPVLNRVAKQELRYGEGVIWDPITSEYLYPKPQPQYEEAPVPQEEPPVPQEEPSVPEPMF